MAKWTSVTEGFPEEDVPCLISYRVSDSKAFPRYKTHPLTAEWDGTNWTDIDGDIVKNVAFWQRLPEVSQYESAKDKMRSCLEKDTCENTECCYFTTQKELSALLKYIKEMEERL